MFFFFTPIPGEMIQFDKHIFHVGWNHQPGNQQTIGVGHTLETK